MNRQKTVLFLLAVVAIALAVALFLSQKQQNRVWLGISQNKPTMTKINLKTKDGISLAADYYVVDNPQKWFVLTHMMPATKESWGEFAAAAQSHHYASLAFDLRGHGQSKGGPKGYLDFEDTDHQKSILDLETAIDYLKNKEARPEQIVLIGASIGANLSLQYLAEHVDMKKAVLFSAGSNYKGIDAELLARQLRTSQKVLLISAKDDVGNVGMNESILAAIPEGVDRELIVFDKGGHGTDILKTVEAAKLLEKIMSF